MEIMVDPKVIEFVKSSGEDYRVSTSCSGPIIIPTSVKPPKDNDLRVKCGDHTLFISRVQARYISRVTMDMVYDPERGLSCSMYPDL
ncbi:MAG: hypothetical protein A4E32_00715 [Methanomassiliicoccales archaeon PtaU1.Bin124]|nr:MAG: hypothetical protein A4E32_00715 [Methanomassiliicoccales archaeon PtaU1.Bin124]